MRLLASQRANKMSPTAIRLTADMREKLVQAASQAGRSLTAELEYRIERSFDQEAVLDGLAERLFKQKQP
jgi:predicted DNA-binding protein